MNENKLLLPGKLLNPNQILENDSRLDYRLKKLIIEQNLGEQNNNEIKVSPSSSLKEKYENIAEQEPNVEKMMAAPVTVLLAYDLRFFDDFARNYPVRPELGDRFKNDAVIAEKFAFQQCTLQGAYLIMAIRAVGLDAGAMGGFYAHLADETFLSGKNWKSNFLCNIGYGDLEGIKGPRLYRYDFDEVCEVI